MSQASSFNISIPGIAADFSFSRSQVADPVAPTYGGGYIQTNYTMFVTLHQNSTLTYRSRPIYIGNDSYTATIDAFYEALFSSEYVVGIQNYSTNGYQIQKGTYTTPYYDSNTGDFTTALNQPPDYISNLISNGKINHTDDSVYFIYGASQQSAASGSSTPYKVLCIGGYDLFTWYQTLFLWYYITDSDNQGWVPFTVDDCYNGNITASLLYDATGQSYWPVSPFWNLAEGKCQYNFQAVQTTTLTTTTSTLTTTTTATSTTTTSSSTATITTTATSITTLATFTVSLYNGHPEKAPVPSSVAQVAANGPSSAVAVAPTNLPKAASTTLSTQFEDIIPSGGSTLGQLISSSMQTASVSTQVGFGVSIDLGNVPPPTDIAGGNIVLVHVSSPDVNFISSTGQATYGDLTGTQITNSVTDGAISLSYFLPAAEKTLWYYFSIDSAAITIYINTDTKVLADISFSHAAKNGGLGRRASSQPVSIGFLHSYLDVNRNYDHLYDKSSSVGGAPAPAVATTQAPAVDCEGLVISMTFRSEKYGPVWKAVVFLNGEYTLPDDFDYEDTLVSEYEYQQFKHYLKLVSWCWDHGKLNDWVPGWQEVGSKEYLSNKVRVNVR